VGCARSAPTFPPTDAKGSLAEVQTQLEIAREIDYIDEHQLKEIDEKCNILGKMLGSLIKARSTPITPDP